MAGDPLAQIPFNFFAGLIPDDATELAWESGYLFVVTSVFFTYVNGVGTTGPILTDAEGNRRMQPIMNGDNTPYPSTIAQRCEIVLGPNSGATIRGLGGEGYCSLDGYAFAPVGSSIW